jgi:hypothetical protein
VTGACTCLQKSDYGGDPAPIVPDPKSDEVEPKPEGGCSIARGPAGAAPVALGLLLGLAVISLRRRARVTVRRTPRR